jgi:hypothetical protein
VPILPPRLLVAASMLALVAAAPHAQSRPAASLERLPFATRRAVVYRTASRLAIDGRLDEAAWRAAPWSEAFVDIEGPSPLPLRTRVRMLWDDERFYVAAELEEPDVWGTLTTRDSVIFADNDCEVSIDPDGDTHAYYELEVNALGTAWDLMLLQPYRDGGPAVHAWDIAGLEVGVDVRGTINRPGDKDEGWTVEIAMPWSILREAAPQHRAPRAGEQWRVNFSRVEWDTLVKDGAYAKKLNASTGRPLPEHNWVWSPQGVIDMHVPERWGLVQFSDAIAGAATTTFFEDPNERVRWALRRLYYRQRDYRAAHRRYARALTELGDARTIAVEGLAFAPTLQSTDSLYELQAPGFDGATVHLSQDGRVWLTRPPRGTAAPAARPPL